MRDAKALFVAGTGTDVGKTYVTALMAKFLRGAGIDVGYYKAAVSGVSFDPDGTISSDATFVAKVAGIDETHDQMVSRTYRTAVSPHLAARLEGGPIDMMTARVDFARACARHDYILMEGSGGIACPLRHDDIARISLDDVVRDLGLPVLLVADAGLGTLNALATTMAYMERADLRAVGIVLNRFRAGDTMHEDNRTMAEELCGVPVVACIGSGCDAIEIEPLVLERLFDRPLSQATPTHSHIGS